MQQSVTINNNDEFNSTLKRINNTIDQGVQWFLWLKPTNRIYTLDSNIIIDRSDVTIQSESTTCIINGTFIVTNGSSLTIINVDMISNITFYVDNGAMVNVSECNLYSTYRVGNGYGRIALINCNVIGNRGFKYCQIYINKCSIYHTNMIFDRVNGQLVDTIVILGDNVRQYRRRSNITMTNSVILTTNNRYMSRDITYIQVPQVRYKLKGLIRKNLLPWVDNKGNPGYIKGDLIDGGRYQIWLAYINIDDVKTAMKTIGLNNQPPDDVIILPGSMIGVWIEVIRNDIGNIRWSKYELLECVGNNLGNFESRLSGLDKELVDQRYWIALARKIPGLNNRPPDKVKVINNRHVIGIWTVVTDLCPTIQWSIIGHHDGYIIGSLNGPSSLAYKLPYNGKLPDHVEVLNGVTYGVWINGNNPSNIKQVLEKIIR